MHLNMDPEAEFGLSESSSEEVRLLTNILKLIRARLKDHTNEVASIRRACCAKSSSSNAVLYCISLSEGSRALMLSTASLLMYAPRLGRQITATKNETTRSRF